MNYNRKLAGPRKQAQLWRRRADSAALGCERACEQACQRGPSSRAQTTSAKCCVRAPARLAAVIGASRRVAPNLAANSSQSARPSPALVLLRHRLPVKLQHTNTHTFASSKLDNLPFLENSTAPGLESARSGPNGQVLNDKYELLTKHQPHNRKSSATHNERHPRSHGPTLVA